jgi:hypothetical protein
MTYLILLILLIAAVYLAWSYQREADRFKAGMRSATQRAAVAERKADEWHELLLQSYVAMQALAEKGLEAEWIREGQIVQPGIWIGDQFIEVEDGEPDDVEVGQPVGEVDAQAPLRRVGPVETYDWKGRRT